MPELTILRCQWLPYQEVNPAKQREDIDEPPSLTVAGLAVVTVLSGGVFLWIWMVMQAIWVQKRKPASKISAFAWVSVVPAALFYINLPSLLLAARAKDQTEIARLQIGMVLWGTIAMVCLVASLVWIGLEKRRLKAVSLAIKS
jgi:uncharacterized protein with PQ loop repeat